MEIEGAMWAFCEKEAMVTGAGHWIMGGLLGCFAVLGLFASSRAVDQMFYYGGFAIAAACILAIFVMISNAFDRAEAEKAHGPQDNQA